MSRVGSRAARVTLLTDGQSAGSGMIPATGAAGVVRTGHGPLGALYPTNTTHQQKEGDTMAFLYLVPTGMNEPEPSSSG